jgi:cytochrome P450 family 6
VSFDTKVCSAFSEIDGDLFVAQALTFLLAGYATTAGTLSFALYELALHPEIQQSLRAEILQVLSKHDGKLTYDVIQDMSYLDRVVSGEKQKGIKQ